MTIFDPFFDPPKITFLHSPRTRAHPARTLPGEGGEGGGPRNGVPETPPPGGVPGGPKNGVPGGGGGPPGGSFSGAQKRGPGRAAKWRVPGEPPGECPREIPAGSRGSREFGVPGGPKTGGRLGVPGILRFLKENPLFPFRNPKSY